MNNNLDPQVIKELQPAITALQQHGFSIVSTQGAGVMFWADFRSDKALIRIVRDRAYWHIDGETEELKNYPSHKSLRGVIGDALDWINKNNT